MTGQGSNPFVLRRGEGAAVWSLGGRFTTKLAGTAADDRVALLEALVDRAGEPPLHIHHREHEAWYVLEGRLTLHVGDDVLTTDAGSFAFAPRGIPHAFTVDEEPTRVLLLATPSGFEGFATVLGAPAEGDVPPTGLSIPPPEELTPIAERSASRLSDHRSSCVPSAAGGPLSRGRGRAGVSVRGPVFDISPAWLNRNRPNDGAAALITLRGHRRMHAGAHKTTPAARPGAGQPLILFDTAGNLSVPAEARAFPVSSDGKRSRRALAAAASARSRSGMPAGMHRAGAGGFGHRLNRARARILSDGIGKTRAMDPGAT